jgi:hypothetical protein
LNPRYFWRKYPAQKGGVKMTTSHSFERRRDQRGDDFDNRLNRIVDRSVRALAEKARLLVEKRASVEAEEAKVITKRGPSKKSDAEISNRPTTRSSAFAGFRCADSRRSRANGNSSPWPGI